MSQLLLIDRLQGSRQLGAMSGLVAAAAANAVLCPPPRPAAVHSTNTVSQSATNHGNGINPIGSSGTLRRSRASVVCGAAGAKGAGAAQGGLEKKRCDLCLGTGVRKCYSCHVGDGWRAGAYTRSHFSST